MRNIIKTSLAVFVVLVVMLLQISRSDAEDFLTLDAGSLVGKKAPEFTVQDLSGKDVSLSSFKGKPILLNFWATWCPHCRKERPYLNSLYKQYKDKGLVIISVSTDRSFQKVKSYAEKTPMDFLVFHDGKNEAAGAYDVYSYPTNFLIDRKGIVRNRLSGMREWTASPYKEFIEQLL